MLDAGIEQKARSGVRSFLLGRRASEHVLGPTEFVFLAPPSRTFGSSILTFGFSFVHQHPSVALCSNVFRIDWPEETALEDD